MIVHAFIYKVIYSSPIVVVSSLRNVRWSDVECVSQSAYNNMSYNPVTICPIINLSCNNNQFATINLHVHQSM